jgi:hypothetical protein
MRGVHEIILKPLVVASEVSTLQRIHSLTQLGEKK